MTKRRRQEKTPALPTMMRWFLAVVLVVGFHVWVRLQTQDLGYEVARSRQLVRDLVSEKRQLELELATLRSPGTVDRLARGPLGLRTPGRHQLVGVNR